MDEVDEGELAGDVQDAELLAHLVGPVVADLLVPAAALLRVEVFPSVERLDELVHPLLVERVRSSGVGLIADVICDAVVEDLRHIEGLGGFGALLHDDHKW